VQFDVDTNMDITVSAKVNGYEHIKISTVLKSPNTLSVKKIEEMKKTISIWQSKRKLNQL